MQNARSKIFHVKSPLFRTISEKLPNIWQNPRRSRLQNCSGAVESNYRLISTQSVSIREAIATADASQLQNVWTKIWEDSPAEALNHRNDLYQAIRKQNVLGDSEWSFIILDLISPDKARLADWQFALELLIIRQEWTSIVNLLVDTAKKSPVYWEQLALFLISRTDKKLPAFTCMNIIASSCVHLSINLATISRPAQLPIFQFIQMMLVKYSLDEILHALDGLAAINSISASSLASGLLRVVSDQLIDMIHPPTILEKRDDMSIALSMTNSLGFRLWNWKLLRQTKTSADLKVFMMFLVYNRMPQKALDTYDAFVDLHSIDLNEPLLLAAAGVGDYARLQAEFEKVEKDRYLIKRLGSERYAIVLKALGFVGDGDVLNAIVANMGDQHKYLKSRAVFHALIYSHSLRGDMRQVHKVYNLMIKSNIEPTRATFSLLLTAFKDSHDLHGMMSLIGDEMLTKYQFGLKNSEFSMLLAVCGKKRDYQSCLVIWKWGLSLLKPDRLSYNAYLHCIVSCNQYNHAWDVLSGMEEGQMVGIDTLSIMLSGAGRSPDPAEYLKLILTKKRLNSLDEDEGWFVSLLSVLNELGNLPKFERAFNDMKKLGIQPNASHYALYTELLTKTKNVEKHEKLSMEMKQHRIPLNFAFIAKHLALLTASGSTTESRRTAESAALQLLKEGYFDPRGPTVPRGAIPVRVIEPVVRRLIKSRQYVSAKRLLDSLRKQWVSFSPSNEEFMIWALYMEVADRSNNLKVVDSLWGEFIRTLQTRFVLDKPGTPEHPPTFKLPPRYRKVFSKQIAIRIRQLSNDKNVKALMQFPSEIKTMGMEMDNEVVSSYVIGLIETGEYDMGFKVASTAPSRKANTQKALSRKAIGTLLGAAEHVNLDSYGELGAYIRTFEGKT